MNRRSTYGGLIAAFTVLLLAMIAPIARLDAQPLWPINFAFNFSSFASADSSTLVQFDFQFSDHGLTYLKDKSASNTGKLYTRLGFRNLRGGEPLTADWFTTVPAPAGVEAQAMVATKTIALPPGNYRASIYIEDANDPTRHDSIGLDLKVPAFTGQKLEVSDIQIASDLSEGAEGNPFYKNGYVVMPNIPGVITPPFLVLNTYMEIYNANHVPTSQYQILYGLARVDRDGQRKIFYSKEVDRPRGDASAVVEVNAIPLDSLPSGDYFIVVRAYNGLARSATDSVTVMREFTLSNPEMDSVIVAKLKDAKVPVPMLTDVIDPIYAGKNETELDEEYAKVRYIATDPEKATWNSMSGPEAKGRFLSRFWSVRDPSPGTPENEDRDAYYKRVDEARNLYTSPMSPKGWDSDRGRVLLEYGKPDGIERHVQDFNRKPYEIWTYSQANYEFVFVDRTQTGFYRLVHSTAPGEVYFENWEMQYTQLSKNWKDTNNDQ